MSKGEHVREGERERERTVGYYEDTMVRVRVWVIMRGAQMRAMDGDC